VHLRTYIGLLDTGERTLAASYRQVADGHLAEADVHHLCHQLAGQCDQHVGALAPLVERYGSDPQSEPDRLHAEGLRSVRSGGLGLLRDLHDLYLLANYLDIAWTIVGQGARDQEVIDIVAACEGDIATQVKFLETRLKQAAPQAQLVAQ